MAKPKVAAVVLNWNRRADTVVCVKSLLAGTLVPEVCVIDNASEDGSAAAFKKMWGSRVKLIENKRNEG